MKTIRLITDPDNSAGSIDSHSVAQTSERDVELQDVELPKEQNDADAAQDAGRYVRRIRKRLGLRH